MMTGGDAALMETDLADADFAVLGARLPEEAEALIAGAGRIRSDVARAQAMLDAAHALAPDHPATLIALYRFHFYGNRLEETRAVAERTLALAARMLDLPADWRSVTPDAGFAALAPPTGTGPFDIRQRFYLFTLKGYAYLCLRLGDLDTGRAAIEQLDRLDVHDVVGHRVLAAVLARLGRDDVGYEDCPDIAGQRAHAEASP